MTNLNLDELAGLARAASKPWELMYTQNASGQVVIKHGGETEYEKFIALATRRQLHEIPGGHLMVAVHPETLQVLVDKAYRLQSLEK